MPPIRPLATILTLLLAGALGLAGCGSPSAGTGAAPAASATTQSAPKTAKPATALPHLLLTGTQADLNLTAVAPSDLSSYALFGELHVSNPPAPAQCATGLALVGDRGGFVAASGTDATTAKAIVIVADSLARPLAEYVAACRQITSPPSKGAFELTSTPVTVAGMPDAVGVRLHGTISDPGSVSLDRTTVVGTVRGITVILLPHPADADAVAQQLLAAQVAKIAAAA